MANIYKTYFNLDTNSELLIEHFATTVIAARGQYYNLDNLIKGQGIVDYTVETTRDTVTVSAFGKHYTPQVWIEDVLDKCVEDLGLHDAVRDKLVCIRVDISIFEDSDLVSLDQFVVGAAAEAA